MRYLEGARPEYYAKVLELRDAVSHWLAYIPNTFPHYTAHTIGHSDEIILQISRLLFYDGDCNKCVVRLSPVEAYILAAAAYLHDAGMVTSDQEKAEILATDEWRQWITNGEGAKRWAQIQQLYPGGHSADESPLNFVADLQTRFLLAEFIRIRHAMRTPRLIAQHQGALGRFAFDNPMLQKTIADVCLGHTLKPHELEDIDRYPDIRDIMEYQANVRFLTIVLRLGDLLDITSDRACPLLLNAANPLPAESLAHWTQYQRIVHRLTTPNQIEITAECETQEEHRVLHDWCQWIVDEVKNARTMAVRFARHHEWVPPVATIEGSGATITVRPASTAKYVASTWHFVFDEQAVLQRIISDAYDSPHAFIRELIQNSLDATRCQMYHDLTLEGLEVPAYPTRVAAERRQRYPITINLEARDMPNDLLGETSQKQVLVISDAGVGMDQDIIERYFLQIGRSYYTTEEFRREYPFVPTSRFGLGFLSVFAVSDKITVETLKPTSRFGGQPIKLTLTGPRSYLLREQGERRSSGTRIEIVLREPMQPGELTTAVSDWCRRVEFPLIVEDLGVRSTIEAERPEDFVYEMPNVIEEGARFVVRAFPIDVPGLEGEVYILTHVSDHGESWARWRWTRYTYPTQHPRAVAPAMPASILCINGIVVSGGSQEGPYSSRMDIRGPMAVPTLGRQSLQNARRLRQYLPVPSVRFYGDSDPSYLQHIRAHLESVLSNHLAYTPFASGVDAWVYKQRLVRDFPLPSFWATVPGTIRVYVGGQVEYVSLRDVQDLDVFTTVLNQHRDYDPYHVREGVEDRDDESFASYCQNRVLTSSDVERLSESHRSAIFEQRRVSVVRWLPNRQIAVDWVPAQDRNGIMVGSLNRSFELVELPDSSVVGCTLHKTVDAVYDHAILNENHPLVQWLLRVHESAKQHRHGIVGQQIDRLYSLLFNPINFRGHEIEKLEAYLRAWRDLPALPVELLPTDTELSKDMFILQHPDAERCGRSRRRTQTMTEGAAD